MISSVHAAIWAMTSAAPIRREAREGPAFSRCMMAPGSSWRISISGNSPQAIVITEQPPATSATRIGAAAKRR